MKLNDCHGIAIQIRNIKSRVEEVSNRSMRYKVITPFPFSSTDKEDSYMEDVRSL